MLFDRSTTARTLIGQMRHAVTEERRSNARRLFDRHEVRPPEWLDDSDPMYAAHRDSELLLRKGLLMWAHIVQANSDLFEKGKDDLPAAVVYGASSTFDGRIAYLEAVAGEIFELKNKDYRYDDEELTRFAQVVTNELESLMHTRVPKAVTEDPVIYTSLVIHRKFLPKRRLLLTWFPIFVLPGETPGSLLLSPKYWPWELVRLWKVLA